MAFVWELTKETINLPLGCLQGGRYWNEFFDPTVEMYGIPTDFVGGLGGVDGQERFSLYSCLLTLVWFTPM